MKRQRAPGMTRQGVRDLDDPNWKQHYYRVPEPGEPYVVPEEAMMSHEIVDLLYCALEPVDRELILREWPRAKFEQTYDFIHEYRTEVRLPCCSDFEWYKDLVRSGLASLSLAFQLVMLDEPDLIRAVLDVERPGWRERVTAARTGA